MFLARINREKPQLVTIYKNFCEANDLDFLEASFRNFRQFFLSHQISIDVLQINESFEGTITPFIFNVEEIRCDSFDNERDAKYDVVYQAFLLLDEINQYDD